MTAPPFGPLGVAMVTPFDESGEIDDAALERLVAHLLATGHQTLVVNGTTGESATTSDEEKTRLVRTVSSLAGDRAQVVAGIGSADTRHTVHLAEQAAAAGADGLLVVTPYYSRPSQAGLVAHFEAVADATDLPVMLYDIPARTATAISTQTLVALASHPRILAVKDAKGDFAATQEVMASCDLAFYSGSDEHNLPLLAMGAAGVVSVVSHVAGREYGEMIAAVATGDLGSARSVAARLVPAHRAVMTRRQGVVAAKAALQLLGVLPSRDVRLPQTPMTEEEVAELATDLRSAGLLS
jgi:4-hydroxy-tetrahydrodipicolinate synthase